MKKLSLPILLVLFSQPTFAEEQEMNLFFNSPSKNIFCGGNNEFVSCMIIETTATPAQPRPDDCPFDWGQMIDLESDGKAKLACFSDFPFEPNARVLNYGERLGKQKWLCSSSEKGMQCENHLGHGFFLSRLTQSIY